MLIMMIVKMLYEIKCKFTYILNVSFFYNKTVNTTEQLTETHYLQLNLESVESKKTKRHLWQPMRKD